MKLQITRALNNFFIPKGCPRALYNATYDDTSPPKDADIAIIVQALLGSSPTITRAEAQSELSKRLKSNWTWKVVLKALIIYHSLLITPRASAPWLKTFFTLNDSLYICQSFREGEGVDPEAESHSPLIRRYASYLTLLVKRRTLESTFLPWDMYACNFEVHDKDHDELFYIIQECTLLLSKCLSPVMVDSEIVVVSKFSLLTAALCSALLKDALLFHRHVSVAIKELLSRFPSLHELDYNTAMAVYKKYRNTSNDFHKFVQFLKISADIVQYSLPTFQTPSFTQEIKPSEDVLLLSSVKNATTHLKKDESQNSQTQQKNNNKHDSSTELLNLLDDEFCSSNPQQKIDTVEKISKVQEISFSAKTNYERQNSQQTQQQRNTEPQQITTSEKNHLPPCDLISKIPLPAYPHPTHSSSQNNTENPPLTSPSPACSLYKLAESATEDSFNAAYDLLEVIKEPVEDIPSAAKSVSML